ncbi:MAG: glutamate--tRNA ligase [Cyanophyceae cyanobacterium]
MSVRVRLAPSPTGNLHIGTARTAVFNWLFARRHQGTFILRIEDTDQERSRQEYTDNIFEGLKWLGMDWDEGPYYQSKRLDLYRAAIQKLLDAGLAYKCYTSAEELTELRESQKARKQAPRYDNRHRNLTPEQEQSYIDEGRQPVIRFKIDDNRVVSWKDMVRGTVTWKAADLGGDMAIARAAGDGIGQPLYNLAVVVDDTDMNISHVIRGEDHIANTAKQILLYEALGGTVPEFAHTPLILNTEGRKLSKRDGVTSISDFKAMGYTAEGLGNYMTLLGWSPEESTQEVFTLAEAAAGFSFDRVNKAGAKFDWDRLNWLNSQYLHKLEPAELLPLVEPYWKEAGFTFDVDADAEWLNPLAELLRTSLTRLDEAAPTAELFFKDAVEYDEKARSQLANDGVDQVIQGIIGGLPDILDSDGAMGLIKQVTKEKGVKKGLVMRSLRAALMGTMQGPEMVPSWLILHQRGVAKARLEAALAIAKS